MNDDHYAAAAREHDEGRALPGLLARCQAEADGDPGRARARYIAARAADLGGARPTASSTPPPQTVADALRGGGRPSLPSPSAPAPPPEPLLGFWGYTCLGALLGLAGLAVLFGPNHGGLNRSGLGIVGQIRTAVSSPPPRPALVERSCDRIRPKAEGESMAAVATNYALDLLLEDAAVEATVRVRNNGGPGEVEVLTLLLQDRAPHVVPRRETVRLEAGESRTLTYRFHEAVAFAGGECQAWAVLPGQRVPEFESAWSDR